MKKFKTITELAKYTFSNNLSVVDRKGVLVTFNDGSEAIATFYSEYFV